MQLCGREKCHYVPITCSWLVNYCFKSMGLCYRNSITASVQLVTRLVKTETGPKEERQIC